ncbi:unnamed protein product [Paramecium primaurelia]|uniref:EF-hand domain-containing protein n=2 Tax=Paramecium TaxID=5884 RepID=A0A8S1WS04_9CILI|nr:unnamed protein product [Paramecium primaurelia]CAD8190979.1 unnamed protein product [Paramecium pentaurelia]
MNYKVESADEYLRRNRIMELFEDLCTKASYIQPENLEEFFVEDLRIKQKQGFMTPIFTKAEVQNIFELFDLKRDGYITQENCRKALLTIASSQKQQEIIEATQVIDEKVDINRFQRLVEQFLG